MSTQQKFATQLQNTAHILDRLAQLLDSANTDNGGMFPLFLASEILDCGKDLESITLKELQLMAEAARERADEEAHRMRELCAGY